MIIISTPWATGSMCFKLLLTIHMVYLSICASMFCLSSSSYAHWDSCCLSLAQARYLAASTSLLCWPSTCCCHWNCACCSARCSLSICICSSNCSCCCHLCWSRISTSAQWLAACSLCAMWPQWSALRAGSLCPLEMSCNGPSGALHGPLLGRTGIGGTTGMGFCNGASWQATELLEGSRY